MSLTKHYKTDAELERKGVGIQFPTNDDGSVPEIFIARAGRSNPDYHRVAERVMKPFRRMAQVGALPAAKQDELTLEIFAEAGIVGWKNIPLDDVTGLATDTGKFADPTTDNKIALLKNLPEVYGQLIELATNRDTFMAVQKAEDAKNSVKSLPTSSSKDQSSAA